LNQSDNHFYKAARLIDDIGMEDRDLFRHSREGFRGSSFNNVSLKINKKEIGISFFQNEKFSFFFQPRIFFFPLSDIFICI